MARQRGDALASFDAARATARQIAGHMRTTGRLLLLGMGASHAVARTSSRSIAARHRRRRAAALRTARRAASTDDKTVIVTSQSGESAEVIRWLKEREAPGRHLRHDARPGSIACARSALARRRGRPGARLRGDAQPDRQLCAASGRARRARRRPAPALAALRSGDAPESTPRSRPLRQSARSSLPAAAAGPCRGPGARPYRAVARSGLCARGRPVPAWPAGNARAGSRRRAVARRRGRRVPRRRHGVRGARGRLAGRRLRRFRRAARPRRRHLALPRAAGLAAIFAMLPAAQRFMLDFAAARVADVGTPRRSTKITRTE